MLSRLLRHKGFHTLLSTRLLVLFALLATYGIARIASAKPNVTLSKTAKPAYAIKPVEVAYDEEWVRLVEDSEGNASSLQTAIARYAGNPNGPHGQVMVDLVGAIHVGDVAYYAGLNQRFLAYQVLLYELVAPEGTVIPRGGRARNDNPMGLVQNGMKDLLDLEHQLEQVDYMARNFVHADMSPEELLASMRVVAKEWSRCISA